MAAVPRWLGCAWLVLALGGCAGLVTRTEDPKGAGAAQPGAAKVEPSVPAAPPVTLDVREERRLAKELTAEIDEYYRLLGEKNVELAASYVEPARRKPYQDDLWTFVTMYKIESAHVQSIQLFPQSDGVLAKAKVNRTLFEKGSVVPQKSEVWMTWLQRGGRWTLQPQEQK